MTFSETVRHFQGKRIGRGKYQAKCPAHRDSKPSLSIREGHSAALVKCWAGCDLESVLRASNIGLHDLWYTKTADRQAIREMQRQRDRDEWASRTLKEYRIRRQERVWMWYRVTAALGWLLARNPDDKVLSQSYDLALSKSREAPSTWPNPVPQSCPYSPFPSSRLLTGIKASDVGSQIARLLKLKN